MLVLVLELKLEMELKLGGPAVDVFSANWESATSDLGHFPVGVARAFGLRSSGCGSNLTANACSRKRYGSVATEPLVYILDWAPRSGMPVEDRYQESPEHADSCMGGCPV